MTRNRFRLMSRVGTLFLVAVAAGLIAACDGGDSAVAPAPAPPPALAPTPAPEPEPEPDPRIVPSAAPFGPAEAGKRAPDPIGVTVTDDDGLPLADAAYRWEADEYAGWVYPPEGVTDSGGRIAATWVPGSPGDGVLTLTVGDEGSSVTAALDTRSVASARPPSGAIYVWSQHDGSGTGYSIDLTPLTDPGSTYYAAIQWDGGYAGLQRTGDLYDRQLLFSMWDAAGLDASVVERGEGVACDSFGGEGTGQKCRLNYPWSVGTTYRFEITEEELDGGSAVTLHVTDMAADERRFVGTLRYGLRARMNGFGMFVEDFVGSAPTCLAQPVRSAALRRARWRFSGAWYPIPRSHLGRADNDAKNPGTPACANVAARDHPAGLEIAMGGRTAMDPDIVQVTIPE